MVLVVDGVVVFYILFELLLLLMYWYLVRHTLHSRGHQAISLLLVYTVVGSALLLVGMVYGYVLLGMHTSCGVLTLE